MFMDFQVVFRGKFRLITGGQKKEAKTFDVSWL
jgi:hypothetical protein